MLHLCHFSLKDSPAKPSMCSFLFTGFRVKTRIYTFSLIFLYKGTSGFQNLYEPFLASVFYAGNEKYNLNRERGFFKTVFFDFLKTVKM